ncbi:MAG: hypothetical protein ACE5PM_00230 [Candidatus Hydrothermarchaeales archaeon]
MDWELIEMLAWILNIGICIALLIFVYKQKVREYPFLKKQFYLFYSAMAVFFSSHIVRHLFEGVLKFTWSLEAFGLILAATAFGGIVPVIVYPRATTLKELIKEDLANPPYLHIVYALVMGLGILFTFFGDPYVSVTQLSPTYKSWYLGYMAVILMLATLFPPIYILQYVDKLKKEGLSTKYLERLKLIVYSYLFLMILINSSHLIIYYLKIEAVEVVGYVIAIVPLSLMAYALKEPGLLVKFVFTKPELKVKEEFAPLHDSIGRSALIEYSPTSKYEDVAISMVLSYLSVGKNVVLVSTHPKTDVYHAKLKEFIQQDMTKLVNVSTGADVSTQVAGALTEDKTTKTLNILINNLEYFVEVTEKIPPQGVLLFTPLSEIILYGGDESAYRFISNLTADVASEGRTLIAFLNRDAHDEKTRGAFEGLFANILQTIDDRLVTLKGEKKELMIGTFERPIVEELLKEKEE